MKFEEILDITKQAVAQSIGAEYAEKVGELTAQDDAKLVDVGRAVTETDATTERYTKALMSIIGRIEFDARKYKSSVPSIVVEPMEWGGFSEEVNFEISDNLIEDPMYNLTDGTSYAEAEHKFYQPKAVVKIFEEAKAFLIPISITREILRESFYSWDKLNSYISGVRNAIANTKAIILETYTHILLSSAAAISVRGTQTAVNLLTMAKNEGVVTDTMTAAEAVKDVDFLTFAATKISLFRKYMRRNTKGVFNSGAVTTFTPKDDNTLVLISEFAENIKTIVKANTFNDEYIGVGDYYDIPCWQAFKAEDTPNFDFETDTTVSITADPTNKLGIGTTAFEKSYIVGIAFDKRAIGICPYRTKVTTGYTAIGDFTNEFHHLLFNYKLNNNFNIVAFVVE